MRDINILRHNIQILANMAGTYGVAGARACSRRCRPTLFAAQRAPEALQAILKAREWLSWEADHITYVAKVRHSARFRASDPATIAEYRPRAEAALSFVDNTVKDQPFLVGDYCTIADIGCWGRMVFMAEGGFDIGNWPNLAAWAGRLKAMPGFALPYELIPSKDHEFDPA